VVVGGHHDINTLIWVQNISQKQLLLFTMSWHLIMKFGLMIVMSKVLASLNELKHFVPIRLKGVLTLEL